MSMSHRSGKSASELESLICTAFIAFETWRLTTNFLDADVLRLKWSMPLWDTETADNLQPASTGRTVAVNLCHSFGKF